MNVLVGCEFSGIVRRAFTALGHRAWSCDLLPADDNSERHYQGDIAGILGGDWDLAIFHPPCTYLCSSGLHWNKRRPERAAQTESALSFVRLLLEAPIGRIALENQVGCISTRIRKPDQIIQPYHYGHPESKATCLWLKNLPKLVPTKILEPQWFKNPDGTDYRGAGGSRYSPTHYLSGRMQKRGRWNNQTPSGQNKLGPSPDRWRERSRTYQGIADAMAAQWGPL